MGKIINLRTARKQKARVKKAVTPAGIKKFERQRVSRLNDIATRNFDAHKRDTD